MRYEFGCINGDVVAIVQGSSEQLYAASSLLAGDASIENKLSSRVRVYDSLRAMSSSAGQIVWNEDANSSIGFILDVIDAVTQSGKRRRLETAASPVSTDDVLDSFGSYVSGSMVEGQDPITVRKSIFSISAQVASSGDSKAVTATLSGDDITSCLIGGEFGSTL